MVLAEISLVALDLPVVVDATLPLFVPSTGVEIFYALGPDHRVHVRPENITRFHMSALLTRTVEYLHHDLLRPQAQA